MVKWLQRLISGIRGKSRTRKRSRSRNKIRYDAGSVDLMDYKHPLIQELEKNKEVFVEDEGIARGLAMSATFTLGKPVVANLMHDSQKWHVKLMNK